MNGVAPGVGGVYSLDHVNTWIPHSLMIQRTGIIWHISYQVTVGGFILHIAMIERWHGPIDNIVHSCDPP